MISSIDESALERAPELVRVDLSLEAIEKGGYKHFMLKEIMEQPTALQNAMRGRINGETGDITLGGIAGEPLAKLCAARRIIIAACGTSFHSGLVGEYVIETLARVPVEVEYGEEAVARRRPRARPCSLSRAPSHSPYLSSLYVRATQPRNSAIVAPFCLRRTF